MKSSPRTRRRPNRPNPLKDIVRRINKLQGWHQHPRNGKIARLPEPTRILINQWLDDGFTYRAILEKLKSVQPPVRCPISEMNLSNWFKGGYQDWANRRLNEEIASHAGKPPSAAVRRDLFSLLVACRRRCS